MLRFRCLVLVVVCFACWLAAGSFLQAGDPQLAHMVYFTLGDKSEAAKEKFIAACHKYLAGHEGTVYFSVGAMANDLKREVNDRDFDVALHLVFKNKKGHDQYMTHPRHLKFIEENKDRWTTVRVFDSYVAASGKDAAQSRIALPDAAASFAGMIRGKVVDRLDDQVVLLVETVPRQWRHSRAQNAEALVGRNVLIGVGKEGGRWAKTIAQFLAGLKQSETVTLDVAHKSGESLTLLELSEEQRKRVTARE